MAVQNTVRLMKESGADAVNLQGGREKFDSIKAVAVAGVPVMSHVGLLPHYVHRFGGFKMQGCTAEAAIEIVDNARAIQKAGAIRLEIEAMPYEVGKAGDEAVDIFTFYIGAGSAGSCQLLNGHDLPGAFDRFKPKFAKRYANLAEIAVRAFADYAEDMRSGALPDAEHSYQMKPEEIARFQDIPGGKANERSCKRPDQRWATDPERHAGGQLSPQHVVVSAHTDEVNTKPMARWLLEKPIVMYRLTDGTRSRWTTVVHIAAPLPEGRMVDDQLVSPCHGMAFGADGGCTKVPTQASVSKSARVQSYPLRQSGAFLWIWMGDPEAIDHEPVHMAYTTDPGWSVVTG